MFSVIAAALFLALAGSGLDCTDCAAEQGVAVLFKDVCTGREPRELYSQKNASALVVSGLGEFCS